MVIETRRWDVSNYLATEADRAAYLNAIIAENDPSLLQAALGDVARSIGMTTVANQAGLGRESLYKALRAEASPSFATVMKVAKAVGAQIQFAPASVG